MSNNQNGVVDFLEFVSYCSPMIIPSSLFLVSSFTGSIVKGVVYLSFLIILFLLRFFALIVSKNSYENLGDKCNKTYKLFSGENTTFGTSVLLFTFFYLTLPMFIKNSVNIPIIVFFVLYIVVDIVFKSRCKNNIQYWIAGDFVYGSLFGLIVGFIMYYSGGDKYLYNSEIQSNKLVCNRPSKQTFRCAVYKNGQMISNGVS